MNRFAYLFVPKKWEVNFYGPDITKGHIDGEGSFFSMMFAIFQILTHKDNF